MVEKLLCKLHEISYNYPSFMTYRCDKWDLKIIGLFAEAKFKIINKRLVYYVLYTIKYHCFIDSGSIHMYREI